MIISSGPPIYITMKTVGRHMIRIKARSPRTQMAQGSVTHYEVQWKNISGEFPIQENIIFKKLVLSSKLQWWRHNHRKSFFDEMTIDGLRGFQWYTVRLRALTTVAPGEWSKWFKLYTGKVKGHFRSCFHLLLSESDLYLMEFYLELLEHPDRYKAIRDDVHQRISDQVSSIFILILFIFSFWS